MNPNGFTEDDQANYAMHLTSLAGMRSGRAGLGMSGGARLGGFTPTKLTYGAFTKSAEVITNVIGDEDDEKDDPQNNDEESIDDSEDLKEKKKKKKRKKEKSKKSEKEKSKKKKKRRKSEDTESVKKSVQFRPLFCCIMQCTYNAAVTM